jgi:protocatechuate 3,4-dioxygenase beta subunit
VNRVARRTVHASLLATIIAAAACGGSDSGPSEPSLGNSTVQLSRDSATLITGDTLRLTATVRDAEGQPVANATL